MPIEKFTGKTLEEALDAAARAKSVDVEDLTYTVTEEKGGFLGIGKAVEIECYSPYDIADYISDYIQTYFDNAKLDGTVNVLREGDDFYRVKVNTNANPMLIGKGGRGLQDFNTLVKAAASAEYKKRIRLLIDVNNYKEERYEKIIRMAIRVAKDVRRTHVDAVLEPMPADERRAVHNALANMKYITTKSMGEGASRQLHILYSPGKED